MQAQTQTHACQSMVAPTPHVSPLFGTRSQLSAAIVLPKTQSAMIPSAAQLDTISTIQRTSLSAHQIPNSNICWQMQKEATTRAIQHNGSVHLRNLSMCLC